MAVCNLFNKLNKDTGNFMMFSQYSEDLIRCATHPGVYRVTPSKFIVLDINYNNFTILGGTDRNTTFPQYLQNYYENGCAYLRQIKGDEYNPDYAKNLFWNCILEANLISISKTTEDDNLPMDYANTILYVGDINIQTYDSYEGMGYSEIYCHIPNDSKAQYIGINKSEDNLEKYIYIDEYILGYTADDYKPETMCPIRLDSEIDYYYEKQYNFSFEDGSNLETRIRPLDKYNFNTIIILYDVYIENSEGGLIKQYEDIPLGVYICGKIENETTTNPGIKFISNDDIYGAGTSYGLRICSKFVITPDSDNIKPIEINTDEGDSYSSVYISFSEMNKTIQKMEEVIASIYNNSQMSKELLAIFKNTRTNVPYVKMIGEYGYWFINGRNTGYPVMGKSAEVQPYTCCEVQAGINEFEKDLGYPGDDECPMH